MLKVLVACEESQRVCSAFRELGHEAYSCDIIEPSGEHPEWHILGDALQVINPDPQTNIISFKDMRGGAASGCTMGFNYSSPALYLP